MSEDIVIHVLHALHAVGVPYVITGALASNYYGLALHPPLVR